MARRRRKRVSVVAVVAIAVAACVVAAAFVLLLLRRGAVFSPQLEPEEAARQAELAKTKEDVVQGRKKATDVAAELDEAESAPADQALFQFRSNEALEAPSALSETMRPLCGNRACGAVVSAEAATLFVRVASLIGAAFPDGGAAPVLAFEMPWTEKPKPPVSTAAPEPVPTGK